MYLPLVKNISNYSVSSNRPNSHLPIEIIAASRTMRDAFGNSASTGKPQASVRADRPV
jgi:hypothetical protein